MISTLLLRSFSWAMASLILAGSVAVCQDGMSKDHGSGDQHDIAALIEDLGAADFSTRESAQRQLVQAGHKALAATKEACRHPDPEIQRRATATLELLQQEVRQRDLARLRAGDDDVPLPGWERFRTSVGHSPEDRRLFAEMLLAEWDTLELAETSPRQANYAIFRRAAELKFQIYGNEKPLTIGNVAALLFAAAHPDVHLTTPASDEFQVILSVPALGEALLNHEASNSIRNVMDLWILRGVENSNLSARSRQAMIMLCMQENLSSGVDLAISILKSSGQDFLDVEQYQYLAFGLLALGKLGSEEHRPLVQEFFDNRQRILQYLPEPGRASFSTELRDTALAIDIHLAGEDPRQFGFSQLNSDPHYLFVYRTIGFSSQDSRELAFRKWADFQRNAAENTD